MDEIKILSELPPCKKILVIGNYDEPIIDNLSEYFDDVCDDITIDLGGNTVYVNHYPEKCRDEIAVNESIDFCITGHIHSLWKVMPKMINVSVDAWHFRPVSEEEILYVWNAIQNHYDNNVFLR